MPLDMYVLLHLFGEARKKPRKSTFPLFSPNLFCRFEIALKLNHQTRSQKTYIFMLWSNCLKRIVHFYGFVKESRSAMKIVLMIVLFFCCIIVDTESHTLEFCQLVFVIFDWCEESQYNYGIRILSSFNLKFQRPVSLCVWKLDTL